MNSNFELEIADLRYYFMHKIILIPFYLPYHELLHFCDNKFQILGVFFTEWSLSLFVDFSFHLHTLFKEML